MKTWLFYADISPLKQEECYKKAYSSVPGFRQEKTDKFKFFADKVRSVAAWKLLEKSYAAFTQDSENKTFGVPNCALPVPLPPISINEREKPDFSEGGLHFNLSHSGDFVLCAISDEIVGCDIERFRKNETGIAERFFHTEEKLALKSLKDKSLEAALFYRIWVLKESFVKAKGTGLSTDFESFSVAKFIEKKPDEDSFALEIDGFHLEYFSTLENDGYAIGVASKSDTVTLAKILL